jgi:hypothetical protein
MLADLDIPIPGQRAPPLLTRRRGRPMTPRSAAPAKVRLIVWCKACQHQVEPDPAEMGPRYRRKVCARMTRTAHLFRRERSSGVCWSAGDLRTPAPPEAYRPRAAAKSARKRQILKPEPRGLSTGWLRITPAPSRASPICERIIEGAAAGTPDPIRRHPWPRTANPPAGKTIRTPTWRNRSAVPLARGTGCSTPVTVPTVGHWIRAWTQRPGVDPYRGG